MKPAQRPPYIRTFRDALRPLFDHRDGRIDHRRDSSSGPRPTARWRSHPLDRTGSNLAQEWDTVELIADPTLGLTFDYARLGVHEGESSVGAYALGSLWLRWHKTAKTTWERAVEIRQAHDGETAGLMVFVIGRFTLLLDGAMLEEALSSAALFQYWVNDAWILIYNYVLEDGTGNHTVGSVGPLVDVKDNTVNFYALVEPTQPNDGSDILNAMRSYGYLPMQEGIGVVTNDRRLVLYTSGDGGTIDTQFGVIETGVKFVDIPTFKGDVKEYRENELKVFSSVADEHRREQGIS